MAVKRLSDSLSLTPLQMEEEKRIGFKEKCAQCLSGPKQIVRSIVLLTCTVVVFYQIAECLKKIKNPPITTYTHFDFNETIRYPALTLCRDPPYKSEVLKKYGLVAHPRITSEWRNFPFDEVTLDDFWNESTYSDVENIVRYSLDESADNIRIENNIHFIRGKCQTLHPKIELQTTGKDYGYSILLNHSILFMENTTSNIPPGYHVFIHEAEEPFMELSSGNLMEHLYVNVGEEIEVKLSVQQVKMLVGGPKSCEDHHNYTTLQCVRNCRETILRHFGCSAPWIETQLPRCNNYSLIKDIIVNYIRTASEVNGSCPCLSRCRTSLYNSYVVDRNSLTIWNSIKNTWTIKNEHERKRTQIYIYFSNKAVSVYEELHSYDWSLFLADFGGSLGFLLGLSVLGVITLLENVFDTFVKPLVPKSMNMNSNKFEGYEKDNQKIKSSKVPRPGGDGDSVRENEEERERCDILKNFDLRQDKYGEKHFYI